MIKKIVLLFILFNIFQTLYSIDPSTPQNGNLYNPDYYNFNQYKVLRYKNDSKLRKKGLVNSGNRIIRHLSGADITLNNTPDITKDSDIVYNRVGITVVLTGNSDRYGHGILGDKIEATGFVVYKNSKVIGEYQLENNRVFETLRATIADIVPGNSGPEILLTVSDEIGGARVEVFTLEGESLGSSDPIGQGFRWLHLLGVAPLGNSNENRVIIVQTPHIGGILKLLKWTGDKLETDIKKNGVSTHLMGSNNLNMAVLFNGEILVPSNDFRSLKVFKVISNELKIIKEIELGGKLNTNIFYDKTDESIWVGLNNGQFVNLIK